MKFRPNQCPTCDFRAGKGTKHDSANDKDPKGTFICFSLGKDYPRIVQKALVAQRRCTYYRPERPKRVCEADACQFWGNCPFSHDRDACDADSYEKEFGDFSLEDLLGAKESKNIMLVKKQTNKEPRDFKFKIIKSQLESDPQLALEIANFLDEHLEVKLEKIKGEPVIFLLKRSNMLGANKDE